MIEVKMPEVGESITEGTITKWFKSPGGSVLRDEPLFEISTDKIDTEVPSPASGVLKQILHEEGETVEIGAVVAVIEEENLIKESVETSRENVEAPQTKTAKVERVAEVTPPTSNTDSRSETLLELNEDVKPSLQGLDGNTTTHSLAKEDIPLIVSPIIRRMILEAGLDPASIKGSGEGGRITRDDVIKAAQKKAGSVTAGEKKESVVLSDTPADVEGYDRPDYSQIHKKSRQSEMQFETSVPYLKIPFSNIRRRTAEHMVKSKQVAPHSFIVREIDFERIFKVREDRNIQFKEREGFSLSYLPFLVKVVVETLREFPHLNASVGNDELIVYQEINIGIAVDLDGEGLVVPVIRNADTYSLIGLARKIEEIASRARTKNLNVAELQGGTFTISNPGPYGTSLTIPIINQPEVAILAFDGIKKKPVVLETEEGDSIAIHSVGNVGVAYDHRAVDGGYVARFLRRLNELIELTDFTAEL